MKEEKPELSASKSITNGCTGQISAVTFCAKIRTKVAIKNLLGEPGVSMHSKNLIFALVFVTGITSANENLRGIRLGDDCESAWVSERALGSVESIEEIPHRKVFEGIAYDMNAYIVYNCNEEEIESQAIMINAGNIDSSQLTYTRIMESISAIHGRPEKNASELFLQMAVDKGFDRNLTLLTMGYSWNVSDEFQITLSLRPDDPGTFYVIVNQ